jgi:hypothetical protein
MGNKESNCILQETLTLVETMLGEEIDTLTVERAVLGNLVGWLRTVLNG